MAVYKRSYKAYEGPVSSPQLRFLVIPRYAFQDLFKSRIVVAFFVGCFVTPLAAALFIYLRYNLRALEMLQLPIEQLSSIDNQFFYYLLTFQGFLGFILLIMVGPGLVSMDLANNALPLYLCRPFNRVDYVMGKMSVLVIILSLITWVPLIGLVIFHASLAGWEWLLGHARIPLAIFCGALILIFVLSLLSLAVSAWVRWRPVAGALIAGIVFVLAGFGEAVNQIMDTSWGQLLDLAELIKTTWVWLFGMPGSPDLSLATAIFGLLGVSALCLLALARKLRAYEVVK